MKKRMKRRMKKALCVAAAAAMLFAGSLSVCAAPRWLADGALFDVEWYAAQNPDVAAAYQGNLSPEALYQHYVTAGAAEGRLPFLLTAKSKNKDAQNYGRWASPVQSYLYGNQAGGLTRVEYIDKQYIKGAVFDAWAVAEDYDSNFSLCSRHVIPMELPIWGGFYAGENYNFVIFGQENPSEDDNAEVVRIVKYSKDWERLGHASLCGANTTVPFDAGSLRCAEYGDYLYIRTSHLMYRPAPDACSHQANMTITVRQSDMVLTDSSHAVLFSIVGYASHSFNQFVLVDKDLKLVTLDHGDAYPRSLALMRYSDKAGGDKFSGGVEESSIVDFPGETGDNDTGASVGGFAETESGYVAAFSYDGNGGQGEDTDRAIYMGYADKNGLRTRITQVMDGRMATPVLAPTGLGGGFVMWTDVYGAFYYTSYGAGGETGEICSADAALSDCQPILHNGELVWYVTDTVWEQTSEFGGEYVWRLTFYRLNPATGEITKTAAERNIEY